MLLESLVKATMELQEFRVMAVTGDAGGLVAELVPDLRFSPRCGQCGAPGRYRDTRGTRRFRHVPLWGIAVALRYAPRRVRCARCAGVHVESLPWVSGKQQMTRALMVVLATWARTLPWQQVARLFRCSWGTVATPVEEAVAYGLAQQDLADLTHIGIDEISRKRGHVYVTNVYDLARKRLVWSGPGRTQATLHAFFDFLDPERTAALEGICCDMWQPYIDVIHVRAGPAVLVFDKFHIVSHLMTAVDQVRRDENPRERPGAAGADAQDAVHLAEESLEPHRAAAPSSERTAAPQSQDQSGVSPEGNLRAFLGLPPRRVGQAIPDALVLVGHALTPAAPARLCLDAAPPRAPHP